MAGAPAEGIPELAERLNQLFARVPRRDGQGLYTNERAAEEITAGGVEVTGQYLWSMRRGHRANPSARLLNAIADLFDVPVAYFFNAEHAARITEQLDLLAGLRDSSVRALSLVAKSSGVSREGMSELNAMLDRIRELEGLDTPEP